MRDLVILGAGGFAREIAWLVGRINAVSPAFRLLGFCDDAPDRQSGSCGGYPLLGPIERLGEPAAFFCAIGNNRNRQAVSERAEALGHTPVTLVDPSARLAPDVTVGPGCVIGIDAIVSVGSRLGRGVIVNHRVCVGHDVTVGDYAQLCPGVCVSGGCEIGAGALMGTLSGIIPLKRVGADATVGAGSCALRDVPDGTTLARVR